VRKIAEDYKIFEGRKGIKWKGRYNLASIEGKHALNLESIFVGIDRKIEFDSRETNSRAF
jgi:hypothetical protein